MDPETKISLYDTTPAAIAKRRPPAVPSFEADEADKVPDLLEYGRVIKKRRATILTIAFVVFTIGLFATLKEKPVYRARVLVEIQKENPDIPTLQELFQVESISDTYLETQYRILKSENLARRVIADLKLDRLTEFYQMCIRDSPYSIERVEPDAVRLAIASSRKDEFGRCAI